MFQSGKGLHNIPADWHLELVVFRRARCANLSQSGSYFLINAHQGLSLFAVVDAMTGRILQFNRQSPVGSLAQGLAVQYSYQQALAKARQVLAAVAPEVVGQVDSYMLNWLSGVSFPSPDAAIVVSQATYDWWNAGGLTLRYSLVLPQPMFSGSGGSAKVRLTYVLNDGGIYVNVASGAGVDSLGQPYQGVAPASIPAASVAIRALPPQGLPSAAAALSWAQTVLPIPSGFKIANVGQGMSGLAGFSQEMWSLSWTDAGQWAAPDLLSASFDMGSGKLNSFNFDSGVPSLGTATPASPAFSRSQALQKTVDFLAGSAGINPGSGYQLEDSPWSLYPAGIQSVYSFTFTPTPNGIPSDLGGVFVTVSSATGQVLCFNQSLFPGYQTAALPSPQGYHQLESGSGHL